MRTTIPMILAAACAFASAPILAQTATLQSRMGDAQFQAAGLHKLDGEELHALEQWIASQQSALRDEPVSRPFDGRHARARDVAEATPVNSTLVGRFEGFARGRTYTLANGQVWQQSGDAPQVGGRSEAPAVEITPARLGGWWMRVDGYNARVRVERVR